MLCPEVANFPAPFVKIFQTENEDLRKLTDILKQNSFFNTLVLTIPDELNLPSDIEECILDDTDYYEISGVSLSEFLESTFIEKFVKNGSLYCFAKDRKCIVDNSAAITPDGILTVHVISFIYHTIGLKGTRRPHNFYEISIDLKNIKNTEEIKQCLEKLELFDFYVTWIPPTERICPSSIAKYFSEKDFVVKVCSYTVRRPVASIEEIPSLKTAEIYDVVEWIGMLAVDGDLYPKESYTSTYSLPECESPIKSSRITVLTVKGFITPNIITKLCENLVDYVSTRELGDYWASVSVQSFEDGLWRWSMGSPRMFHCHESSTTLFVTHKVHVLYSIGHIKFS